MIERNPHDVRDDKDVQDDHDVKDEELTPETPELLEEEARREAALREEEQREHGLNADNPDNPDDFDSDRDSRPDLTAAERGDVLVAESRPADPDDELTRDDELNRDDLNRDEYTQDKFSREDELTNAGLTRDDDLLADDPLRDDTARGDVLQDDATRDDSTLGGSTRDDSTRDDLAGDPFAPEPVTSGDSAFGAPTDRTSQDVGAWPVPAGVAGSPDPAHDVYSDGVPGEDIVAERISVPDAEAVAAVWHDIKAGFVDDPRAAVEKADALVEEAVTALTSRRQTLLDQWKNTDKNDTEQLRVSLRAYRELFDQLKG